MHNNLDFLIPWGQILATLWDTLCKMASELSTRFALFSPSVENPHPLDSSRPLPKERRGLPTDAIVETTKGTPLMKRFTHVSLVGLILAYATSARGESVEWIRQLGTTTADDSYGVSADGLGNVFISGFTFGRLENVTPGGVDAFVSKYNSVGNLLWTRQLGTTSYDDSKGVSADGLGNVYISGSTLGSLGGPSAGNQDVFLSKFSADGSLVWSSQFGTTDNDYGGEVSVDGLGNVYFAGSTAGSLSGGNSGNHDGFVRKYNAGGGLLWTRQFGTAGNDGSGAVSADGLGNVYLAGATDGILGGVNVGGIDAFVRKYNADGSLLWTRQLGTTSTDVSGAVSADKLGNVYISGYTGGNLGGTNAGGEDAFLSKYSAEGSLLWTRQFGTTSEDISTGVSVDGLGNVYLSGYTVGSLGGPSMGGYDAFVMKYDAAGNLLWKRQLGTRSFDNSTGVSADGLGNVYLSGITEGSLSGTRAGQSDSFLVKIADGVVPEPSSFALSMVAVLGLFVGGRRRWGKALTAR
jgi:Beta-propeller repeat/PEP-CTERM motif